MTKKETLPTIVDESQIAGKAAKAIMGFIGHVPASHQRHSKTPLPGARKVASTAAAQAALAAGSLALPPGPLGWLTILPEMVAVWKIQAQMVANIAATYGKTETLSQEQVLYCLFRHTAAQAVRDIVVRVGERFLVKRASLAVIQNIAHKIGIKVTKTALGKGLSRFMPLVGALGVGAYAYYDTTQVAKTAIELFSSDIQIEPLIVDGGHP